MLGSPRFRILFAIGLFIGLLAQICMNSHFKDPFFSIRLPWALTSGAALVLSVDALCAFARTRLLSDGTCLRSMSQHALALGLYSCCLLATYWPALPRPFWPGKNFMADDYPVSFYVSKCYAIREFAQGRLPLWNPYLSLGLPAHAEMTQATFYPPSFALMPFMKGDRIRYRAYFWFVIGHFIVASWGAYLLARSWHLGFLSSWLAGLCFGFSGFFALHAQHPNMVFVACWLPFLFMTYEKMVLKDSFFWAWVGGLGQGIVCLGSYPLINIIYSLFFLGYIAFLVPFYLRKRRARPVASLLRLCGLCSVGFGLAVLVAAVQLIPTQELSALSKYATKSFAFSTQYGTKPLYLLSSICPQLFTKYVATGDVQAWESYAYIGIVPLLLICMSFSSIVKTPRGRFLFLATLVALFLAMAKRSVWHEMLFAFAPLYGRFEAVARWCLIWSFCLSLGAAIGIEKLMKRTQSFPRSDLALTAGFVILCLWCASAIPSDLNDLDALVSTGFFIVAGCAFAFLKHLRPPALFVLVLLAATDLLTTQGWRFPHRMIDESIYDKEPRLEEFRDCAEVLDRVASQLGPTDPMWLKNSGSLYRIPSADGYVNLPVAYGDGLLGLALNSGREEFLDLMGIRCVVKKRLEKTEGSTEGDVEIMKRENPFRRAWLVWKVLRADRPREAWDKVIEPRRDLKAEAVVLLAEGNTSSLPWSEEIGAGTCEVLSNSPMEMSLRATSDRRCLLVVSDLFYPGWKASCDGQPAEILRTDYCLRGILLDPGDHQVLMQYRPFTFRFGAAISTLSGVPSLLLLACWGWSKSRRIQPV